MGLSDGPLVSPLVLMKKLRSLVCVWHQLRNECKQMDLKRASREKRLLQESECVRVYLFKWMSECQCVY